MVRAIRPRPCVRATLLPPKTRIANEVLFLFRPHFSFFFFSLLSKQLFHANLRIYLERPVSSFSFFSVRGISSCQRYERDVCQYLDFLPCGCFLCQ